MRYELTETERRLSKIIWENEPLRSSDLVKICTVEFDWKKSTTYTMLKKLENKGLFCNEKGTINALMSEKDVLAAIATDMVDKLYEGSISLFLNYYLSEKKLSDANIDRIQKIVDAQREAKGWSRSYIRL